MQDMSRWCGLTKELLLHCKHHSYIYNTTKLCILLNIVSFQLMGTFLTSFCCSRCSCGVRVRAAVGTAGAGTGARTTFNDRSPNGTAVGAGGGIFGGQGGRFSPLPILRLGCTGTFGKIGKIYGNSSKPSAESVQKPCITFRVTGTS
jgi:hypothetical protein